MDNKSKYKDGEEVIINGRTYYARYAFGGYLGTLPCSQLEKIAPACLCMECLGSEFQISYDGYTCIANCKCGNKFNIYN